MSGRVSPNIYYEKTLVGSRHFSVADPELIPYLKEAEDADQTVIAECLNAAVSTVEEYLWKDIDKYAVTQYSRAYENLIEFSRMRPLFSETIGVSYYNEANALTALTTDDFYVVKSFLPHIKITANISVYDRDDAFVVTYTTGFATPADVPPLMKMAIYRMTGYYYECRIDERKSNDSFVEQLCIGLREYRF